MRLPIQYALTYPDRRPSPAAAPDLVATARLDFRAPDEARFPALRIAREAGPLGPRATAALIAADDVAVGRFLDGSLDFPGIPRLLETAVARFGTPTGPDPDLDALIALDAEVRASLAGEPGGVTV
jgi:1-deoxy-D-xylulose-5-phosphate reductoisomerase